MTNSFPEDPVQAAIAKIAENVEKITALVEECEKLSEANKVPFSLSDLGYMSTQELEDSGWSDSNCW